jgi:serine/threonine protein kinase
MATVYRAYDPRTQREVALKVLAAAGTSAAGRKRFLREGEALAKLSHPNVVRIFEVGEEHGRLYTVLELSSDSETLEQRLARGGPLASAEAASTLRDVAQGLQRAHESGVLHRDVKPGNVLLSAGRALLIDFGLAGLTELEHSRLTQTGQLMGTVGYCAPEQAAGERATELADVYGLGATLYAALTGRAPHVGASALQVLSAICDRRPVAPPSSLQPSVDRGLEALCLRCLRHEPSERPASAAEVAEGLERIRREEGSSPRSLRLGYSALALALAGIGYVALSPALSKTTAPETPEPLSAESPLSSQAPNSAKSADPVEDLLRSARAKIEGKNALEALLDCERALELDGERADVSAVRALAYAVLGEDKRAVKCAKRALKKDPDQALDGRLGRAFYSFALMERERGAIPLELGRLAGRAIALGFTQRATRLMFAAGLQEEGLWAKSLVQFDLALEEKKGATAFGARGFSRLHAGDVQGSFSDFQSALATVGAQRPEDIAIGLAERDLFLGHPLEAATRLETAVASRPTRQARNHLASAYQLLGKHEGAVEQLTAFQDSKEEWRSPILATVHVRKALSLVALGLRERARAELEQAVVELKRLRAGPLSPGTWRSWWLRGHEGTTPAIPMLWADGLGLGAEPSLKDARKDPWSRGLVRFWTGAITAEQLLALAKRTPAWPGTPARWTCTAQCFIGLRAETREEVLAAKIAYRACRDANACYSTEQAWAVSRLRELESKEPR